MSLPPPPLRRPSKLILGLHSVALVHVLQLASKAGTSLSGVCRRRRASHSRLYSSPNFRAQRLPGTTTPRAYWHVLQRFLGCNLYTPSFVVSDCSRQHSMKNSSARPMTATKHINKPKDKPSFYTIPVAWRQ